MPRQLAALKRITLFLALVGLSSAASATYTFRVPLKGLVAPFVVLATSPSSLSFGNLQVGTQTSTQLFTLSNKGNVAASLTLTPPVGYSQTNNCGPSLMAGGSCTVSVTFSPPVAQAYNSTFGVSADGNTASVSLSGNGAEQSDSLSTVQLNFPNTDSGSTSSAETVTITNSGVIPLSVSTPQVQGHFSATTNCTPTLAPGASCSVNTVFKPTGGTETGTLTIPTGVGNQTISLSGYGLVYTYVSSGYWKTVPVTSSVECDWHNTVGVMESGGNLCGTPPNTYSHPTDNWNSTWYNCHGAVMESDNWSCPCGGCPGTGGETAVEYETVTTNTQVWVDTSYYVWE